MSKRAIAILSFLLFTFAAGAGRATGNGPGLRHTFFMAGSVIESNGQSIYLCIGSPEGAKVGQEFDVIRVTRDHRSNPKLGGARFTHTKVGTVKIDAIVDEHYAEATVTAGKAEKGDIVRLSQRVESPKES